MVEPPDGDVQRLHQLVERLCRVCRETAQRGRCPSKVVAPNHPGARADGPGRTVRRSVLQAPQRPDRREEEIDATSYAILDSIQTLRHLRYPVSLGSLFPSYTRSLDFPL